MRGSMLTLVAGLVVACVPTQPPQTSVPAVSPAQAVLNTVDPLSPIQISAAQRRAVEAGVRDALRDPDSARFGEMVAGENLAKESRPITVCGMVNAKNAYGGYTGEQPFMGVLLGDDNQGPFAPAAVGGIDTRQEAILQVCQAAGLYL